MIAAIVLASWVLVSFLALSLCVVAGSADRALELMVAPAPREAHPACDFVAGFAEPEPEPEPAAVSRPVLRTRT